MSLGFDILDNPEEYKDPSSKASDAGGLASPTIVP